MKKSFLLLLLVSTFGFSQSGNVLESINDYKYAIVPAKFDFFKEADKFRLNTNTKLFMEKYGFTTYFDSENLPDEIANQNCNKVFLSIVDDKSMFETKLTVVLKDCRNNVLFTSATGSSREKDYKVAYNQALREAFNSFDALNHQYNGKATGGKITPKKEETVVLTESFESPVATDSGTAAVNAQPILNGFQLVDTTPKIVLKIYPTTNPDVYIASNDTKKGVLVKNNGQWFFEYYENNKLFSQQMNIKF
ncbi:MAG TPA: hypothetical protein VK623_06780 [Flavobacterium sp.]|nr:hypothetical protein [Flavobacterium sp.]